MCKNRKYAELASLVDNSEEALEIITLMLKESDDSEEKENINLDNFFGDD